MQVCDSALDLPVRKKRVSGREREGEREKQNTWQLPVQMVRVVGDGGGEGIVDHRLGNTTRDEVRMGYLIG